MSARILIIEDKQANLDLMSYLLNAFGHAVRVALDGEEGLAAVRRDPPDLIVCDIHLPGTDGYEVARRLGEDPAYRHIPRIAVTALAMVGDREKVLAAGFDGYISKPIVPENFVSQVDAFLPPELRSSPLPAPERSAESRPPATSKHALLLVVDDNAVERTLMYSVLDPSGYDVRMASNVLETLELMRSLQPALVVCDVNMPGGTGFDLLRAIAADPQLRGYPVIITTATAVTVADRHQALELGALRFATRPMDPQDFLSMVEECLADLRKG